MKKIHFKQFITGLFIMILFFSSCGEDPVKPQIPDNQETEADNGSISDEEDSFFEDVDEDFSDVEHLDVVYALAVSEDVLNYLQPKVTITKDGESRSIIVKKEDCVPSSEGIKFETISARFTNNNLLVWSYPTQLKDFQHTGEISVEYSYLKNINMDGLARDYNLFSTPEIAVTKVTPGKIIINTVSWSTFSINAGSDETSLKEELDKLIENPETRTFISDANGKIEISDK